MGFLVSDAIAAILLHKLSKKQFAQLIWPDEEMKNTSKLLYNANLKHNGG